MSAYGTKRTLLHCTKMSAFGGKADSRTAALECLLMTAKAQDIGAHRPDSTLENPSGRVPWIQKNADGLTKNHNPCFSALEMD